MKDPTRTPSPIHLTLLLALLVLVGCARSLPEERSDRALLRDLTRVVETRETVEWLIDSWEVQDAAPAALRSTCRASPAVQLSLDRWLDAEIAKMGGRAAEQFKQGADLDDLDDVLTLERVQLLLRHAHARHGECPFWIEPDDPFTGVHNDEGAFVLLLESSGGGALVILPERVAVGGSGGGRLLFAGGFAEWLTLGLGAEIGGNGLISEGDEGSQDVAASVVVAVPLLMRFIINDRLLDVDLAAVNLSNYSDLAFNPGFRVAVGTGVATVRTRFFMPTAVFSLEYEYQPEGSILPTTHFLRVRSRFGIDIKF